MRLYLAGYESYDSLVPEDCKPEVTNVLISYYQCKDINLFKRLSEEGKYVFLDSGAFSAFTQNKKIDINRYMDFIKKVEKYIKVSVSLDVIGDGELSLQNYKIMSENGFNPIPCFHPKEDFKILDYYCEKSDYVGLGGIARFRSAIKRNWYNQVFSKYPNHKFHGFAQTTHRILFDYPWYSVDSTSWLQGGKFGRIVLPGAYMADISNKTFLKNSYVIKALKKYYKDLDIDRIISDYKYRNAINVTTYLKIEKEINNKKITFKNTQKTLF